MVRMDQRKKEDMQYQKLRGLAQKYLRITQ